MLFSLAVLLKRLTWFWMFNPKLFVSVVLSLVGHSVLALPASLSAHLTKVGEGDMRWLFMDLYRAEYFSEGADGQGAPPVALKLHYRRDISSNALVKATISEWERMNREHEELSTWSRALEEIWPDVKKNDEIVLFVDADKVSTFYLNNNELGRISDTDFYKYFLDIWMSADARNQSLRFKLLGVSD